MFTHKNATKGTAIREIAVWSGIELRDIVAFGDDLSDVEMLRICGKGVAVANAKKAVKDITDDICDSNNEDGVAKWIHCHIGTMIG